MVATKKVVLTSLAVFLVKFVIKC